MFRKSKLGVHTEVIPGIYLKTLVYGQETLMTEVRLEKGAIIPLHAHPHEQTGYLITGQMEFIIDGKPIMAYPGDSWSIAGDIEHSAKAVEETTVVEVFSPVREDYLPYYTSNGTTD